VIVPPTQLKGARTEVNNFAAALATLLRGIANGFVLPGADLAAHLQQARRLGEGISTASLAVKRSEAATRLNPAARRDRPAVQTLQAAVGTLTVVERPARGIARALADAPSGWRPPDGLGKLLGQLLVTVAGELDAWGARVTSETAPGGPASPDAVGTAADVPGGPAVEELYQQVLVATRARDVEPETAAIVAAIALDAHRISQELRGALEAPAATLPSWRALFAP
jgi:hypothetical protein